MADNSVTIALKLDTTHFQAGLAQAQSSLSSFGISSKGRASSSKGRASSSGGGNKIANQVEKTVAYLSSMQKGNLSSFNVLGAMKGLMGASAMSLGVIAVGVLALVSLMAALQMAFKPINSVLTAIGKILGAALMPISMIIITLLKPFIYLMMPLIRLMMFVFRPLRLFLAQRMRDMLEKSGGNFSGTDYFNALMGGIGDWLGYMLLGFSEQLTIVLVQLFSASTEIANVLTEKVKAIFDAYRSAFGVNIPSGGGTVVNAPGTKEAGTGTGGKAKEKEEEEVAKTVDPIEMLKQKLGEMKTEIDNFNWLQLVYDAKSNLMGADNSVKSKALEAWNAMIKEAGENLPKVAAKFKEFVNLIIRIANGVIDAINFLGNVSIFGKQVGIQVGKITEVQDFILQPGGRLIKTDPNDTITGTKNPGGAGGGTLNLTINVAGNMDDRTAKYITDIVQREIATQWRAIAR